MDDLVGWAVAPLLFMVTLPLLAREALRHRDRRLLWILAFALLVKFAGAVARHYVISEVYGGVADASGYHGGGAALAERFKAGDFDVGPVAGTNFIKIATGVIYLVTGPTIIGGFFVYAWLAYLGLFLCYRAFVIALPEAHHRRYALLLFLLPSLVFWPSSIGKDAWMVFTLGLAIYGSSRLLTGEPLRGLALVATGLWLAGLVRPHIAGLVALSLALAVLIRRSPTTRGPLRRVLTTAGATALALVFVTRGLTFLEQSHSDPRLGLKAGLETLASRTSEGGSAFGSPGVRGMVLAPVTVLFRPLLFDARNLRQLVAGVEGTFLLVLLVRRRRGLVDLVRVCRGRPYVAFALISTGAFIVAFSGFRNFGILARERVQLLPLLLALLAGAGPSRLPARGPTPERPSSTGREEIQSSAFAR